MSESRLIVGLGNPGKKYEYSRHNAGFLVISHMAEQYQLRIKSSSLCKGMVAEGKISKRSCRLLFPLTYMNNAGEAVKRIVSAKSISYDNILVICDDLNLPFGQLRIRVRGSDGGHNGLKSIIDHLGSKEFARLRFGVGPEPQGIKGTAAEKKERVDFVLAPFNRSEKKQLEDPLQEAVDCCSAWLTQDISKVMSQFNKRKDYG